MTDLLNLLQEDNPLAPVPEKSKQGWWFLASVMIGCTICVPVFVMGAELSQKLPYSDFALAVFLGGCLCATIAGMTGIVGQRTGLPTSVLARIAFGAKGCILANAAMTLAATGWFGIQTSVFGNAFSSLAQQIWHMDIHPVPVMIIAGLLMSSTAVVGFRGLGKLSYIATPLLIVLLVLPLWIYYSNGELAKVLTFAPETAGLAMGTVIAIVGGAYSFTCTMPDTTRFMRNKRDTITGVVLNFVMAYPLLLLLTGSSAIAAGQNDFMQIMIMLGFGTLAIAVLFLATWTTNDTNVYAGALAANLFLPEIPRWKVAAFIGVAGTALGVLGIFEHFMSWLIFSGNMFAPMAGVYVADYWLDRRRYDDFSHVPAFRPAQVFSWLAGLAVGLSTTGKSGMGFELFSLTTVPMLDALLTSGIVLVLLKQIIR